MKRKKYRGDASKGTVELKGFEGNP